MAHKVLNASEALSLLKNRATTLDTLASAIVRGYGLNQTENKAEFFFAYMEVSNELETEFLKALEIVFNPKKSK